MTQYNTHQWLHTPGRQGVSGVTYTEEWYPEHNSDPVADRETPLPGDNMG